jgi:hypothetical protein
LEGWAPAMAPGHSAEFLRSGLKPWRFVHEPSPSSRGSSAGAHTPGVEWFAHSFVPGPGCN